MFRMFTEWLKQREETWRRRSEMHRDHSAYQTAKIAAVISNNHEKKIRDLEAEVATLKEAFRDALDNDNAAVKALREDNDRLNRELSMYERKLDKLDPNWREDTAPSSAA